MRDMEESAKAAHNIFSQKSEGHPDLEGGQFTDEKDARFLQCLRQWILATDKLDEPNLTVEWAARQTARRIMKEVQKLVADGTVPPTVSSFSELHDYVDANCLGDTESFEGGAAKWSGGTEIEADTEERFVAFLNNVQGNVDAWIKNGGVHGARGGMKKS